jgi:translation elongation factor EF-Tu-like GTPase
LKGRGTVATGRVEQGTIKVGEEVEILGLSKVKVHLTFFFLLLVKHPHLLLSINLLGCDLL